MLLSNLIASPPDDRDFRYVTQGFNPTGDISQYAAGIENQLGAGACTTHAVGSVGELILTRANRSLDLSFQFGYDVGRIWEARRGESGMYLRDALKVAHKLGIPREAEYPYRGDEVTLDPPESVIALAGQRKLGRYESIDMSGRDTEAQFSTIRSAITEGCPVVIAMRLGAQFYNIFGPRETHRYPALESNTPGNGYIGNHAMVIEAYGSDWLDIENSWGIGFGDSGFIRIGIQVLTDIFEAWAVRGFAGIDPTTQAAHDWAMAHPEAVRAFALAQWPNTMQVLIDALITFGLSESEFEGIMEWQAEAVRSYSQADPVGNLLDWRDFNWG